MGARMAARLAGAGHELTVWSRSGRGTDELRAKGARVAGNATDAVRGAAAVVSMLWDDEVARTVTRDQVIPAMHAGATLLEMTTISPQMTSELARAAAARGVGFVAGPVTGSTAAAADGTLTVMIGGADDAVARVDGLLQAMSSRQVRVGSEPAAAATLKLANNAFMASMIAALGDALRLCRSAGIPDELALSIFVPGAERVSKMKAAKVAARDDSAQFALDGMLKDTAMAVHAADAAGTPHELFHDALAKLQRLHDEGHGDKDFSLIAF